MIEFDYDPKGDAFELFKKGEKIKSSVEVAEDYFINLGQKGTVVGLEILKASEALGLSKKELKAVKDVELYTSETKTGRKVVFMIRAGKVEVKSQILVPRLTA